MSFKIVAIFLLAIEGLGGIYAVLIGLEFIKTIPPGLDAINKIFFILVGTGIVLLVISAGLLLCRFKQDFNLCKSE